MNQGFLRSICVVYSLLVACSPTNTQTLKFRTPEGAEFVVSKISVLLDRNTAKKTIEVSVIAPAGAAQSQEAALSDLAFEGVAGPSAEEAGADDAIVDVFPATSGFLSINAGYRGHYVKLDTGTWSREDGEQPPALRELTRVRSPEGRPLVMTSRTIHKGELFLVFFCENCAGPGAIKQAAGALYDIAPLQASCVASVRRFHATVFAGIRHTAWDMPPIIFIEGRRDQANHWQRLNMTRAQFISLVEAKLAKQKKSFGG